MDDYISKTIKTYNNNPQKYANNSKDLVPPEINEFISYIPKKGIVLDAGCAAGRDSRLFKDKGFSVIGVDLSEELLKMARKDNPQIEFFLMDFRKLIFPDNYFDGIWCNASLHHLNNNDAKKALNEFYRVLKPKGVFFVSVKEGSGSKEVLENLTSDTFRFYAYQTKSSLDKLLQEASFKSVKTYAINEKDQFRGNARNLSWVNSFSVK